MLNIFNTLQDTQKVSSGQNHQVTITPK